MNDTAVPWLRRAYVAALFLHAAIFMTCFGLAGAFFVINAGMPNSVSSTEFDSAPNSMFFSIVLALPFIAAGLPSTFALLSWYLCRRQGVKPSAGHAGLTCAAAIAWLMFIAAYGYSNRGPDNFISTAAVNPS